MNGARVNADRGPAHSFLSSGSVRAFRVVVESSHPMRQTTWLVNVGSRCWAPGCNRAAPAPAPAAPAAAQPPFRPVADVKQLMASVVEPAAEVYWDAVGSIADKKGVVEIAPKTDEEWIAVRNSAYVVAEAGNLLMMSSRARDNGEWMKLSEALVDVGQRAIRRRRRKIKRPCSTSVPKSTTPASPATRSTRRRR